MLLKPKPTSPFSKLLQLQTHNPKTLYSTTLPYNANLGNSLSRGDPNAARQLFDEMPHRTLTSWNSMLTAYANRGEIPSALSLIPSIHASVSRLNAATFTAALGVCARSVSYGLGTQLHCLILKSGSEGFQLVGSALLNLYSSCFEIDGARRLFELLNEKNPLLWSPMVVGYVRCNMIENGLALFDRMPKRDVVSWTALISGFARSESGCETALELFLRMPAVPNEFTYDTVLRACGVVRGLGFGRMVHGCLVRRGFECERSIVGALIEFYCQCDVAVDAKRVFDQLGDQGLSISNAMIGSLLSVGRVEEAELIFRQMVERDVLTYHLLIKGYGQDGRLEEAKRLFSEMQCRNIVSWNIMISVYHQNGESDEALKLFERIKGEKDTVTWNSMISGYVQNEQTGEALRLYALMHRSSIECSRSTFSALFRACAGIGTLQQGRMCHAHLCKTPFESNVYVGTSLVDMYAKCGSIADARASFLDIISPNVASWTALIIGFAHHGHALEAILEFGRMLKHRIVPNAATFVGVLLACIRASMIDDGKRFFHSMQKNYGLVPNLKHYACMVDLLGRSGCVKEAERLIEEIPIEADDVIWVGLLSACWFSMDLEVGERVADKMFSLYPKNASIYIVMSNIYAKLGRWEDVLRVRKRSRDLNLKKDPGCSWIEVKDMIHVFSVEDRNHPQKDEIYAVLDELAATVLSYPETNPDAYTYTT